MIPSVKTLMNLRMFDGALITRDDAKRIRSVLEDCETQCIRSGRTYWVRRETLARVDAVLRGCGVERIEPGNNMRSPAIDYVNMGDTYDTTLLLIRGRFRVGCWGDIVERGNYD